jgi:LPXTG-motif cell wall-anchored protein
METETPEETSYKFTTEDWLLIVLAIIFCILLLAGVVWGSRRRKNLGG